MDRASLGEKIGAPVGKTVFNADELHAFGVRMIDEFGDYHRVFWNCQAALEYAYTSKTTYNGSYWVAATNQASLLAGYQNIAKYAQPKFPPDTKRTPLRSPKWLSLARTARELATDN
jgi:hypothetical protein